MFRFSLLLVPFLVVVAIASDSFSLKCASLVEVESRIRFSTPIYANSNFTGDSPETSHNTLQTALPATFRVASEVKTSNCSTARFEIWLPSSEAWNSRILAVGNGGWVGGINYPDIVTGLKKGKKNYSLECTLVLLQTYQDSQLWALRLVIIQLKMMQHGQGTQSKWLICKFIHIRAYKELSISSALTQIVGTELSIFLSSLPKKSLRSSIKQNQAILTTPDAQLGVVKDGMKFNDTQKTLMGYWLGHQQIGWPICLHGRSEWHWNSFRITSQASFQ